jgi:hypothetical protein
MLWLELKKENPIIRWMAGSILGRERIVELNQLFLDTNKENALLPLSNVT